MFVNGAMNDRRDSQWGRKTGPARWANKIWALYLFHPLQQDSLGKNSFEMQNIVSKEAGRSSWNQQVLTTVHLTWALSSCHGGRPVLAILALVSPPWFWLLSLGAHNSSTNPLGSAGSLCSCLVLAPGSQLTPSFPCCRHQFSHPPWPWPRTRSCLFLWSI